jgi:hypothetical protein
MVEGPSSCRVCGTCFGADAESLRLCRSNHLSHLPSCKDRFCDACDADSDRLPGFTQIAPELRSDLRDLTYVRDAKVL